MAARRRPPIAPWAPLLAFCVACGGATGGGPPSPGAGDVPETAAERARAAYGRGELEDARREAGRALRLDPADPVGLEIAARTGLARGEHARVADLLADATAAPLVRLRARALFRIEAWGAVARDLAAVQDARPADGWAAAALPIARSMRGRDAYRLEGAPRAELRLRPGEALPVVEAQLEGRPVAALISTAADVTVVDASIAAAHGGVDRVGLGEIVVRDVPVLSRDLADVSAQLGTPIGLVIGLELLLRLHATLDLGGGRLLLFASSPPPAGAAWIPFVTLDGSFLAVEATFDGDARGWVTLDTAAAFPVALDPRAAEAMGHVLRTLPVPEGAPSEALRLLVLARLRLGEVEFEEVPAFVGLVPPELASLSGAPIAGILGAGLFQGRRISFDPRGRRIGVE